MKPLVKDLQTPKNELNEFSQLTQRVLNHIENVITGHNETKGYFIYSSSSAGVTKYTRPINRSLFFFDSANFKELFETFNYIFPFSKFILDDIWKLIDRD